MGPRFLLVCALAIGCASDPEALLSVDLRSDYIPGREIAQVSTRLELGGGFERRVTFDLDSVLELSTGTRIASFDAVEPGSYRLHVEAVDGDGATLASRFGVVEVRVDTVVTIVLSRACQDRSCPEMSDAPEATECVGGVCVPPECFPETPELCGMTCSNDGECLEAECGRGVCRDSLCQLERDPARCASGLCSDDYTCVPPTMDAGTDAGTDSGPEPAPDAGPPPPSCPPNARSCPSALTNWVATTSWSCRGDEKLTRAVHRATCRVCNAGGCSDCEYGNIDVDCRCREPSTCSGGRCTSGISSSSSRCDEGGMDNNFACPEITNVVCRK